MSILPDLKDSFRRALAEPSDLVGGLSSSDAEELLDLIRSSSDPKFGDYQANLAMPLGKRTARPPREVAAKIVERLEVDDFCHQPQIAGPGFINLRIKNYWLTERLTAAVKDSRLDTPKVTKPRTYVIDYSAPNVAKPMHVGHIRSTVIGDAVYRMLAFIGHHVISDNHLGDWGTQFGMIIYGYRHFLKADAYKQNRVEELARLYRVVSKLAAEQSDIGSAVLAETAKLHAGDEENLRLWREFLPACRQEIERVYQRLDVKFDYTLGESSYNDQLGPIVDGLLDRDIARESDGAICVFTEGREVPMIVRKQDGAFLYATTDLATIRYRMENWNPDAILYVVDHRQGLHFEQLFATARRMGYEHVELQHISFGTVLGEDGRPFRTRSGDVVGLEGLLDEAVRRASKIVAVNDDAKPDGPELSTDERARIAETVGIAALKYADLSQNRTSDYVFSYDKMLAMNGNTATYMQYAYARVRSIFRKGNVDVEKLRASAVPILLNSPAERALGLEILRFADALDRAVLDYRPNQLTGYLFDLANRYSTFFEQCHVLRAENDQLRQSRLLLCDLTARTIRKGLELLGIDVVEKM